MYVLTFIYFSTIKILQKHIILVKKYNEKI